MTDNIDKVAYKLLSVATKLKEQLEGFKTYSCYADLIHDA